MADTEPSVIADRAFGSDLIDVTALSLEDLRNLPETAVAKSLRRIRAEMDSPQDAVAGFQSSV
ncbi:FxSxx-COOH cyclophane-containing RiPP peptide [Planosporangium sp. 12N6]|uniref:FxSxx-COOH cyclophane-containing RiPP peptide n=1 Tax=Planosporangium spinosum TaxID=3402278 RepID=UPI003CF5EFC0